MAMETLIYEGGSSSRGKASHCVISNRSTAAGYKIELIILMFLLNVHGINDKQSLKGGMTIIFTVSL